MDLDDLAALRELDSQGMLAQITALPRRLEESYDLGPALPMPECGGVERILVAGEGACAAGVDLLAGWAGDGLPVQLQAVPRLPLWGRGRRTLAVAVSAGGESEPALELLAQACSEGCPALALTAGGRLAALAGERGVPVWPLSSGQAASVRSAEVFALLHCLLHRGGWVPDPQQEVVSATHAMRNAQMNLLLEVPAVKNPAKRLAGQMVGRWVALFAAGFLAPVARRWKAQLNRTAKTWAQVELLPEAASQSLVGLENPGKPLEALMALFLRAPGLVAGSLSELDAVRMAAMQQGINTDFVDARGETRFAQMWTSLLFADYTAFYLAAAYGLDPAPAHVSHSTIS